MRVRPSQILHTGSRTMVPTLIAVSLYLLLVGHDSPGGGFVGGLLAGTALLVAFLTGGRPSVESLLPAKGATLLGSGIGVAVVTAVLGMVFGAGFLDAGKVTLDLGPVGEISVGSALAFDAGVYLVVVGLVAEIVSRLGDPVGGEGS